MVNTRIIVCLFVLRKGIILLLVDYFKSSYHCYRLPLNVCHCQAYLLLISE
jgi:hypothetical protein